jgi:predicted Rossmann fold flavoprotein
MKIVIIGGGAAGFMSAITAARVNPSAQITILEKSAHLLSKVRISGGGRCNITHRDLPHREFATHYPRGEKQIPGLLHHFSPADTIDWFRQLGLQTKTETDGRIFPVSDNSASVIECLLNEAKKRNIRIETNAGVDSISVTERQTFHLKNRQGNVDADRLIIACGGFPKRHQYLWLNELGHQIIDPVPSLFTFNLPKHKLNALPGIAVSQATVRIPGAKLKVTGPVLITHWGLSGPAILKSSAMAAIYFHAQEYRVNFSVNWMGEINGEDIYTFLKEIKDHQPTKACNKSPFESIASRLWQYFLAESGIDDSANWQHVSFKQIRHLSELLTNNEFRTDGVTRFKEEFVTAGGIDLKEIDLRTMASRVHPGLFFAGEIINIDGVTGGFNFQNAWTTGYIAGTNAAY